MVTLMCITGPGLVAWVIRPADWSESIYDAFSLLSGNWVLTGCVPCLLCYGCCSPVFLCLIIVIIHASNCGGWTWSKNNDSGRLPGVYRIGMLVWVRWRNSGILFFYVLEESLVFIDECAALVCVICACRLFDTIVCTCACRGRFVVVN